MNVVRLTDYKNRDTLSVLKGLVHRAFSGEIVGLALCLKTRDGSDESYFTGLYKDRPNEGSGAALRLSMRLMKIDDDE